MPDADNGIPSSASEKEKHKLALELEAEKHKLSKELETYRDQLLQKQETRKLVVEMHLGLWRALFEYAQISIRTIVTVNGLGATAIIAFMGNALREPSANSAFQLSYLGAAAASFAVGVTAGVLATMFAYFSQYEVHILYKNLPSREVIPLAPGKRFTRVAAILCIFAGLGAFLSGVGLAIAAYAVPHVSPRQTGALAPLQLQSSSAGRPFS